MALQTSTVFVVPEDVLVIFGLAYSTKAFCRFGIYAKKYHLGCTPGGL